MNKIHQTHFTVPKEMPWHEKTEIDYIKGCPNCHHEMVFYQSRDMDIKAGWFIDCGYDGIEQINYCPFCGVDLRNALEKEG